MEIKDVTIYGSATCPLCERAKMVCNLKKIPYSYNLIGVDIEKDEVVKKIGEFKTVPQIIINDGEKEHHIGGFQEFYNIIVENS